MIALVESLSEIPDHEFMCRYMLSSGQVYYQSLYSLNKYGENITKRSIWSLYEGSKKDLYIQVLEALKKKPDTEKFMYETFKLWLLDDYWVAKILLDDMCNLPQCYKIITG
jgi:hypothetical protein